MARNNIYFLRSRRDAFKSMCTFISNQIKYDTPIMILGFLQRLLVEKHDEYREMQSHIDRISDEEEDKLAETEVEAFYEKTIKKMEHQRQRLLNDAGK